MSRYYLIANSNVRSIVDGNSGEIVDEEPVGFLARETVTAHEARIQRQDQRCAALNREDHELRQPFGELRATFGAGTGQ
jgi:hypothetical protein